MRPEAPEIEGSGTASDPWKISSPADWNAVAESINSGAADAVYLSTACYELSADIDFEGQSAVPVSFETGSLVYFGGVFDGKGHTIRNVKTTASGESFGLFGGNEGRSKICGGEPRALDGLQDRRRRRRNEPRRDRRRHLPGRDRRFGQGGRAGRYRGPESRRHHQLRQPRRQKSKPSSWTKA